MKTFLSILAFFIFSLGLCLANSETDSIRIQELQEELRNSLQRLKNQRDKELTERATLGENVSRLETQLLIQRRKRQIIQLSSQGKKEWIQNLEKQQQLLNSEAKHLSSLYKNFAVSLERQLQSGQQPLYQKTIDTTIQSSSDITQQSEIIDAALSRLDSALGGEILTTEIATSSGKVISGFALNIGPSSWFLAKDSSTGGKIHHDPTTAQPLLIEEDQKTIHKLFNHETAFVNIDFSNGKAHTIKQDSGKLFQKGGAWLWVILAIALIATVCAVLKCIQLSKLKEPDETWMKDILTTLQQGDRETAKSLTQNIHHPIAPLINKAIDFHKAGADAVEAVLYEQLIGVRLQLQKWLPFIAVTAATAPLLGLLGTVSGMIRMFEVITIIGTSDVKPMAGGISEALITTLFGLTVAIPALILHTILSRKSNSIIQNTEKLGLSFVNGLRKQ